MMYFWLHWVFVAVCELSLAVASGGCSLVVGCRLLTTLASRCRAWVLGCVGFLGLVALRHVGSSQTRD